MLRPLLLSALLLTGLLPGNTAENPGEIRKSVIRITNAAQIPDYKTPWNPGNLSKGRGSGLVVAGNRILTNAHVVSNSRFLTVERDGDPKPYTARVAHIAHDCDLALLEVQDAEFFKGLPPLAFDGIPAIDSSVSVYGYPVGGDRLSVTRGIVSRVDFQPYSHSGIDSHLAIQIDAAINPGNSGGPVLQNGKVVGVAFQGYSGDVAQNVGYMIPVPVIERFLKDVADGTYDRYMDLALNYFPLINPAMRKAYGLKDDDRGVVVTSVVPKASADGHLLPGDVLLAADGKAIGSDGTVELNGERVEMPEMVERKYKGDSIGMLVLRGGQGNQRPSALASSRPLPHARQQLRPAPALRGLWRPGFPAPLPQLHERLRPGQFPPPLPLPALHQRKLIPGAPRSGCPERRAGRPGQHLYHRLRAVHCQ
jgi:S1-C subfamily serine protease